MLKRSSIFSSSSSLFFTPHHHHHHHQQPFLLRAATSSSSASPFLFTSLRFCSTADVESEHHSHRQQYRPRLRPRKLVLPVDPHDLHHDRRQEGRDGHYLKQAAALRKKSAQYGAVKLGVVPDDKTFADLFGAVLQEQQHQQQQRQQVILERKKRKDNSNSNSSSASSSSSTSAVVSKENLDDFHLLQTTEKKESRTKQEEGEGEKKKETESTTAVQKQQEEEDKENNKALQLSLSLWDELESTPLSSPRCGGLGPVSLLGQSLVQSEVIFQVAHTFPRLRSCHHNSLLHTATGLQPMLKLARKLGLLRLVGLETDAGLWNELCNLHQREQELVRLLRVHRHRQEKGIPNRQTWYYQKKLRGLRGSMRHMPTDASYLLPRVEWIRNVTFAFFGWVEIAEGEKFARELIRKVVFEKNFFSLLDQQRRQKKDKKDVDNNNVNNNQEEEQEEYEDEIEEEHPSNSSSDRAFHRQQTTTHAHGSEPFDDPFSRFAFDQLVSSPSSNNNNNNNNNAGVKKHRSLSRRVIEAINPDNALKEAQIILNYSPHVPRELFVLLSSDPSSNATSNSCSSSNSNSVFDDKVRREPGIVKFDIEIKTQDSEILESDSFGSNIDPEQQSFHTPKTLVAELVVFSRQEEEEEERRDQTEQQEEGKFVLGRGIGTVEQEAMQAACLDFVRRYYLSPLQ